jgi:hypothetical protein
MSGALVGEGSRVLGRRVENSPDGVAVPATIDMHHGSHDVINASRSFCRTVLAGFGLDLYLRRSTTMARSRLPL